MSNTVTRDHHNLRRNLKLNDNYISNDGGDEGISIDNDGIVTMSSQLDIGDMSLTASELKVTTGALNIEASHGGTGDITLNADGGDIYIKDDTVLKMRFKLSSNPTFYMYGTDDTDYFRFYSAAQGVTYFLTTDGTGAKGGHMHFDPDGDVVLLPAADRTAKITPDTRTVSGTNDTTLLLTETLDLDTGADGSDVHYGIKYTQTQTDLTGWDSVYLMYLEGGNKFTVDDKAQLFIDINDTSTIANTNKGIHIDIDSTGMIGSGSLTHTDIGLDIDINRDSGNGHGSSTTNTTGIDIDLVGQTNGTTTNTGINIAVSAADTNYALITSGGNVGIGVADPDQALEVNGDIHVENTVYFTAETANAIGDGATGAIDWNTSQKQKVTITGTGITCNFTDPAGACNLLLKVVQGDGSDVIATWDSDIKWPTNDTVPTLSTGNGDIDIISFYFDGTNYFGVASLDFA